MIYWLWKWIEKQWLWYIFWGLKLRTVALFPRLARVSVSERQSSPWQLYIMRPSGGLCSSPAPGLSSTVGSVAVTLAFTWHCVFFLSRCQSCCVAHVRPGETWAGLDVSQMPSCSFNVIYLWFVAVFLVQWSTEATHPQCIHAVI